MASGAKTRSDDEIVDALARILDKETSKRALVTARLIWKATTWRTSGPLDAASARDPRLPIVG